MTYGFGLSSTIRTSPTESSAGQPHCGPARMRPRHPTSDCSTFPGRTPPPRPCHESSRQDREVVIRSPNKSCQVKQPPRVLAVGLDDGRTVSGPLHRNSPPCRSERVVRLAHVGDLARAIPIQTPRVGRMPRSPCTQCRSGGHRVTGGDAPLHRRVSVTRPLDLLPSPAFSHAPHVRQGRLD